MADFAYRNKKKPQVYTVTHELHIYPPSMPDVDSRDGPPPGKRDIRNALLNSNMDFGRNYRIKNVKLDRKE